jgi:hypothetical protein
MAICTTISHNHTSRPLHYMLLGPFNGLQNWQYAQISTQKKYAQIYRKKKILGFRKIGLNTVEPLIKLKNPLLPLNDLAHENSSEKWTKI